MNAPDLYDAVFGGEKPPYDWQVDFAEREWPEVLLAPTGSGKTAGVALGWIAHRLRSPESTPRRLVWCLPMRTLVEQTENEVKGWMNALHDKKVGEDGVLPSPEDVHVLMGGVEAARWLDEPENPAIIIGTQDMLLSRALMRGYASSRAIWPMEFALLHTDTQWVFDEVQLMGSGRATSTQLEAFRRLDVELTKQPAGPPSARSLWISATLKPEWLQTVDFPAPAEDRIVNVSAQVSSDSRLDRLATAKKNLEKSLIAPASAKNDDMNVYIDGLADFILEKHRTGHLTLVIINRVKRAQDLYEKLKKNLHEAEQPHPKLALIHSRFRAQERKQRNQLLENSGNKNLVVVATQAVEAGVDVSAAVLISELAPWPSMVQRFGRANRYAELEVGADIFWVDLTNNDDKQEQKLASPYEAEELKEAKKHLDKLTEAAPVSLPEVGDIKPERWVIRRKDIYDLFDTDPDLTGFDVDISPYIRDADNTDVRVFWRDLSEADASLVRPRAEELCAVPIYMAKDWLDKARKKNDNKPAAFVRDPQWKKGDKAREGIPAGWVQLWETPQPGQTILVSTEAGGYSDDLGFTGNPKHKLTECEQPSEARGLNDSEGHDEDPLSETGVLVELSAHLGHVAGEAKKLCQSLGISGHATDEIIRAARWHDLGKAHDVFQNTMQKGREDSTDWPPEKLLAKTQKRNLRHERSYFRHELASALAFLAQQGWTREADLVAYLVAAHHGKVRMNVRALPKESPPTRESPDAEERADSSGDVADSLMGVENEAGIGIPGPRRFARGVWEGDRLEKFDLGDGEIWDGGELKLSVMELGRDEETCASWTERTRELLERYGPFQLAWMETLVRVADWRASGKEQQGGYSDE